MIPNFITKIIKPLTHPTYFRFGQSVLTLKRQKQAKLAKRLKQTFQPSYLEVTDTTLGGSSCGQMYKIIIESNLFQGKSKVAQHQLVSQCLAQELKNIHAFNLKTKVPKKSEEEVAAQKPKTQKKQQ